MINAAAEFERDLLIGRAQAGLDRARAEGKRLGRPASPNAGQQVAAARQLEEGMAATALARKFKTSRQTILRVKSAMPAA